MNLAALEKPMSASLPDHELSAPALRAFFNIMRDWQLGPEQGQALLASSRSAYFKWRQDPESGKLTHDQLERLSYILGIYKALQILIPDTRQADAWVQRDNDAPLFNGAPPIKRMEAGHVADLYQVRAYLDAVRGGA
jgi:hypothetical protein